jgi:hypothetical protein
LYVNRQFTRRIVDLKREESGEFSPLMTRSQKRFDWGTQIIS